MLPHLYLIIKIGFLYEFQVGLENALIFLTILKYTPLKNEAERIAFTNQLLFLCSFWQHDH
jgi:hypothetical protein